MPELPARRRRVVVPVAIVLVLVVLGGLAGLVSAAVRGTTYTSEAQLTWDPSVRAEFDPDYNGSPDSTTFDRQVADQQDVVLSDAVVGRVADSLDLSDTAVRDAVAVTTTSGSSAFSISATARTAQQAQRIAAATTTAYLAQLRAANSDEIDARVAALTPVISTLRTQLRDANATAAGPIATNIATLEQQQAELQAVASAVPVEATVQRAATAPAAPSSLSMPVSLIVGAALGLVVGVCIVLLVGSLPARRTRDDDFPVRRPVTQQAPQAALSSPAPEAAAPAAAPTAS